MTQPNNTRQLIQALTQKQRIHALKNLDIRTAPFLKLLNAEKLQVLPNNEVEISLTLQDSHYNMLGSIHGGVACTLLDSVNNICANIAVDKPFYTASVDMHIHYIRPIFKHTGTVHARAKVLKTGTRIIVVESGLYDSKDQLMAHSIGKEIVLGDNTPSPS